MATATITQTQTVASADAGWSVPLGFPQFDLSQGMPLGVQVGVTGTITGSASIENLGAAAADVHIQLPGTISVVGPDGTLLTSVAPDPSQIIHLGAYDGTTDFSGNSGTIVSNISASATAASVFLVGTSGPVPFGGTGTLALTASSQASSSVAGNGNLLVVTHAQAGAAISVQYDYQALVGGFTTSSGDTLVGGFGGFVNFGSAQESTTATQTLVVPDATTGWNTTLAAAQFNSALGTLLGVNLTLISDINGGFAAENLGSTAGSVNMSDTAAVTISLPGTIGVLSAAPSVTGGGALSQFDGTVDFAGHSGIDQTGLTNTQTLISQINSSYGDLSSFIGTGTIALPIGANSTSLVTGPADLESKLLTKAGAVVMVSYVYASSGSPPVVAAPAISGTVSGQTTSDLAAIVPFANVTIADANSGQAETVTVTQNGATNGTLSNLGGGSYNATIGIYTNTGSATEVTDALDGLVFTPTAHQVAPGQTVSTGFTIADTNTVGGIASDQTMSVVATAIATPVISGIVAARATYNNQTINPFAGVTVSDADSNETVKVIMSWEWDGKLSDAAGGYSIVSSGYAIHDVVGMGFNGSSAQLTNWLQQLVYTPDGIGTDSIGFTLTDTDTAGTSASALTTVVVTAPPAVISGVPRDPIITGPLISGASSSQEIDDQARIAPFSKVVVSDLTAGIETLTVTLSAAANGTLTNLGGGNYNATTGVYSDTGSAAAVTTALNGLIFRPAAQQVAPGQSVTTMFTIDDTNAPAPPAGTIWIDIPLDGYTTDSTTSVTATAARFAITDTTSGGPADATETAYTGPVSGIEWQFISATTDSLNIAPTAPNAFIHSGSGDDAIDVSHVNGNNILDGGTGSNFLVGGSGGDTFFLDDRGPASDIWSTVVNFHAGDSATIWGVTPSDFTFSWIDGQGASGYSGLTLQATAAGVPTALLTLAGLASADLTNGTLTVTYGTTAASGGVAGSTYMLIHAN